MSANLLNYCHDIKEVKYKSIIYYEDSVVIEADIKKNISRNKNVHIVIVRKKFLRVKNHASLD